MTVSERVHYLRKTLLRITQGEFASRIKMSRSNFSNIENCNTNPTDRVLSDICREFSVNREWLETGAEPIFAVADEQAARDIMGLYSKLSGENRKYAQGYMHRLLEEQNSPTAAFLSGKALTEQEIDQLRALLESRKGELS